jgi:hypothetical protein
MIDLQSLITFFTSVALLKVAVLLFIAFYGIFAFVVFNQVQVMNRLVQASFGTVVVMFLALLHLGLVGMLFFLALIVL